MVGFCRVDLLSTGGFQAYVSQPSTCVAFCTYAWVDGLVWADDPHFQNFVVNDPHFQKNVRNDPHVPNFVANDPHFHFENVDRPGLSKML